LDNPAEKYCRGAAVGWGPAELSKQSQLAQGRKPQILLKVNKKHSKNALIFNTDKHIRY
jgi:hypothetical protein